MPVDVRQTCLMIEVDAHKHGSKNALGLFKQPLHVDYVQPAAEFEAHLTKRSHLPETEPLMEMNAHGVIAVDQSHDGVEPAMLGRLDQTIKQGSADALTVEVLVDVDRVLCREPVPRSGTEWRQATPACHGVSYRGDQDLIGWAMFRKPPPVLLPCPRLQIEGGGGVKNGIVVDLQDGALVGLGGFANGEVVHNSCAPWRGIILRTLDDSAFRAFVTS